MKTNSQPPLNPEIPHTTKFLRARTELQTLGKMATRLPVRIKTFRFMVTPRITSVGKFIRCTTIRTRFVTLVSRGHIRNLLEGKAVDDCTHKGQRIEARCLNMNFHAFTYIIVSAPLATQEGDAHVLKKTYVRCASAVWESHWEEGVEFRRDAAEISMEPGWNVGENEWGRRAGWETTRQCWRERFRRSRR